MNPVSKGINGTWRKATNNSKNLIHLYLNAIFEPADLGNF
jgi:hypothetical protein